MNTILVFTLLGLIVATAFVDAAEEKIAVGCLGKFPVKISKAISDCKISPPTGSRKKRKAAKATEPPMLDGGLSTSDKKNAECAIKALNLVNDDGIDSTEVRRLMDSRDNYPMGQKQVAYWKKVKECGFKASDARKEKAEEIEYFVNCVAYEYRQLCK